MNKSPISVYVVSKNRGLVLTAYEILHQVLKVSMVVERCAYGCQDIREYKGTARVDNANDSQCLILIFV